MKNISITDADGKDPLPICQANRQWMIDYYKLPEMILIRYFSDDVPVQDQKKIEESKATKHIRECPRCREWIHTIAPKDIVTRQARLTKYCCAGMFVAVEEANKESDNQISFTMFRDEDPCWMINGKGFVSYCPWCGKKLPEKPFID